ncbi:hypothetical protein ABZV81_19890 [Streptomyces parvus]|uniref:Uncharacterized protein n=1 Tax=Streptomyces sp. JL1001 TaxID=3078227 RepID=A0AAU8KMZ5_9ACTN|nr:MULTISPECIES: hypothetical protein [unclassified Streptomyces]PJN32019.1 hypothetical protein CG717_14000 [Streptomyces sp. CB02613]SCD46825.1 hypothetical protein GA0115253_1005810 [Streptomyces sp. Termitarium-T10T-6]
MADNASDTAQRTAERLAAVCAHAEVVRDDLRSGTPGEDALLERLLAAMRTGDRTAEALEALHSALRAAGDPLGLDGYTDGVSAGSRSLRPAGVDGSPAGGHHGEIAYFCPLGTCARYWFPEGPAPVPKCSVIGRALRRDRL